MKVVFFVLLCVAAASAAIYCPPDACDRIQCSTPLLQQWDCGKDRYESNGGVCGCCPVCITQMKVEEDCSHLMMLGATPTSECEGNLRCDWQTRKCAYRCQEELASAQNSLNGPSPMLGAFKPNCEEDGSYSSYQCQGSKCYCVAKDGTEITGYSVNRWEADGMNCNCARAHHEYSKTGMIGLMFNCEANGNYKKVQCKGSVCFCADEETGQQLLGASKVHISQSHTLEC